MKITRSQLKETIKEELSKFLNEDNGQLQVNLLSWDNEYDQTSWTLNVNGKEMRTMTSGGSDDVESEADWIADGVIGELFDDDALYVFLLSLDFRRKNVKMFGARQVWLNRIVTSWRCVEPLAAYYRMLLRSRRPIMKKRGPLVKLFV